MTELTRLHRGPAGEVSVDRDRRMGGRGAHVCNAACLAEAVRRKGLQRAFRAAIGPVPSSLDSKDR